MKVVLSLDDFSIVNNRLDLLFRLKEHFPNFKVSLFTIPIDEKRDWGPYLLRGEYLKKIKNLNWIQIIPHGYIHNGSEMRNADYRYFKEVTMPAIKRAFERDGITYEKGFKAPHWRWSDGVVKALDEEGWWGAIDPRQPNMSKPKKFYCHSHAIDEPFRSTTRDLIQLHGHIYGTRNDLGLCMDNLLKIPRDVEWCFATDFLEEKND